MGAPLATARRAEVTEQQSPRSVRGGVVAARAAATDRPSNSAGGAQRRGRTQGSAKTKRDRSGGVSFWWIPASFRRTGFAGPTAELRIRFLRSLRSSAL